MNISVSKIKFVGHYQYLNPHYTDDRAVEVQLIQQGNYN